MNIETLRGQYEGQSAIILGAGTSLKDVHPSIMKGRVSIAINDAVMKFPQADFYLTMDPTMPTRRHWDTVLECGIPVVLKKTGFEEMVGKGKTFPDEKATLIDWRPDGPNGERSYRMSQSDTDLIIGGSSAHSAVNFAVLLGCKTIYLVGCDCRAVDGRHYFWQWEGQEEFIGGMKDEDPQEAFAKRNYIDDNILRNYVTKCWRQLRDENPDIKIIDASDGLLGEGILETVSLSDLQGD